MSGESAPETRVQGRGRGWHVSEHLCRAGPGDRPFEERHGSVSISVVAAGTFTYHGEAGRALLHPGAFLLGNHGRSFACGHDHGRGDRCIALHLAPDRFAEIAATAAGSGRFAFAAAMLPAAPALLPVVAAFEAGAAAADRLWAEEAVVGLTERVLAAVSGHVPAPAAVSARDERRIARALHHAEAHAADAIGLDALAAAAAMSKYHFLRTFRRTVGQTPYRFVLGVRMRRAALRLARTADPVSAIAFDSGFGDLSTFNRRFRAQFGESPRAFRRRYGRAAQQRQDRASGPS